MIQATFQHKQLAFYFSFHQFSGQIMWSAANHEAAAFSPLENSVFF